MPPGGLIAGDVALQVAWYSDRPAVETRRDLAQIDELEAHGLHIAAIYTHGKALAHVDQGFEQAGLQRHFEPIDGAGGRPTLWVRRKAREAP